MAALAAETKVAEDMSEDIVRVERKASCSGWALAAALSRADSHSGHARRGCCRSPLVASNLPLTLTTRTTMQNGSQFSGEACRERSHS